MTHSLRQPGGLATLSDAQLLQLRARVDACMEERGLSFRVGDLGEELAIGYFNSTRGLPTLQAAPNGTRNVDAISRDGDRYSIKTILKAKKTGTIYPDNDDPDKQLFEFLLVVKLARDYSLSALYRLPWLTFCGIRAWDRRMNAWYVPCSKKSLSKSETLLEKDTDQR